MFGLASHTLPRWMKNQMNMPTKPVSVPTFFEKKSQAQSVSRCRLRKSSQVPSPRRGPGSKPLSLRILITVERLILPMPSRGHVQGLLTQIEESDCWLHVRDELCKFCNAVWQELERRVPLREVDSATSTVHYVTLDQATA